MHEFKYRNNELHCEGVKVADVARKFGTPAYIYSKKTLIDHFQKIKQALKPVNPLICFSIKANSNLALLKTLSKEGAGMDVVSGGELFRAKKIGVLPKKIVYAGVGKSESEITEAIRMGILFFNVESEPELISIDRVARGLKRQACVCLRVNPDVEAHTHKFITTGKSENKFGLDMRTAEDLFLRRHTFPNIELCGIHIHIGSQVTKQAPFVKAIRKILKMIARLSKQGIRLTYLNIGGGLGIIYRDEKPQTAKAFARAVVPLLKKSRLKIILEPGRFIAGNSGILVARVAYVKKTPLKNFAIVDAGMNDLIRPSLYDAYHEILPVKQRTRYAIQVIKYDIVGPICESGDFFAKGRKLSMLEAGDFLAIMSAGAYGFTMSSNYNSRPRAAEVLVDKNKFSLIRRRETYSDLIRQEIMPRNL